MAVSIVPPIMIPKKKPFRWSYDPVYYQNHSVILKVSITYFNVLILLFVIEYANDTDNIGRKQPPVRISWKFYN